MYSPMTSLIDKLETYTSVAPSVIEWSCPVPFFGDLRNSRVATVGINPSNREFVSEYGLELTGAARRFPTLGSLKCLDWSEVTSVQVREIIDACLDYFNACPYDRWFRVLERIIQPAGFSFYGQGALACHIDLVPYATAQKWGTLSSLERRNLLMTSGDAMGRMVRDSKLKLLILNGRSVISEFERISSVSLDRVRRPSWDLPRTSGTPVEGYSYHGEVSKIGDVHLEAPLGVVGYNHNLQSSFGVTSQVISEIGVLVGNTVRSEI